MTNHIERLRKLAEKCKPTEGYVNQIDKLATEGEHARLMKILLPTLEALEKSQAALIQMNHEPDLCACNDCELCYPRIALESIDEMLKGVE